MNDQRTPRRFNRGRNVVTLQDHLEKVIDLQVSAIKEATNLAKDEVDKRLDGMNEFRDALKDQASRFVTRTELLAAVVGISTIISIIVSILVKVSK